MGNLTYELDTQHNKWIIPTRVASEYGAHFVTPKQPKRLENGPVIVSFTASKKDESAFGGARRGRATFTAVFINETQKDLKKINDKVIKNDILNSFRAAKHKICRARFLESDADRVTKIRRCGGRVTLEVNDANKYRRTLWLSRKQQAVEAFSEYVGMFVDDPPAHDPMKDLLKRFRGYDIVPNKDQPETVRKQTLCCESNSSKLNLGKLTIRELADGICDPSGDIKEEYLKSEFLKHGGEKASS